MRKAWRIGVCVLLAMGLVLGGCGVPQPGAGQTAEDEESADRNLDFGLEPDFSYEVPTLGPNIIVDPAGYESGSAKIAVFPGGQTSDTFTVLDRKRNETVYSGILQRRTGGESFAVFTDLDVPGVYRVESGSLGQSYDFTIEEKLYAAQLEEAVGALRVSEASAEEGCYMMAKLLLAWELYPGAFGTGTENPQLLRVMRAEAEWLLAMQDAASGAVYGKAGRTQQLRPEEETLKRAALYCAAMAKFGYDYRNVDNAFATQCLKAADRAWKYAAKNNIEDGTDELLFAAAEMFRATGRDVYRKAVEAYAQTGLAEASSMTDAAFYGEVTYLSTRKGVDKTLCAQFMKTISDAAERISRESRENAWLVAGSSLEEMLRNMEVQAVVNYIITNHEYETVIENHLHYLSGRSKTGEDLRPAIYEEPKSLAAYIFLLSAVCS